MQYARQFKVEGSCRNHTPDWSRYGAIHNANVPGVIVPEELIQERESPLWDERICDGMHIMAIGHEELVSQILEAAGL